MAGGNFRGKVGHHRRRLAADARHVFGVGGARDRADAHRVLCRGFADQRHAALFRQLPPNVMEQGR
jgi:hypothetical protein